METGGEKAAQDRPTTPGSGGEDVEDTERKVAEGSGWPDVATVIQKHELFAPHRAYCVVYVV